MMSTITGTMSLSDGCLRPRHGSISHPGVASVTLVVDRDSLRGLRLAIALLASQTGADTPYVSPDEGRTITVVTRTEIADKARAELPVEVLEHVCTVVYDDGQTDRDTYHAKIVAASSSCASNDSVLILDNPPTDSTPEAVDAWQHFDRVIIISSYPVFRPGVDAIVAAPPGNQFMWPSLYEAYLSKSIDRTLPGEYKKATGELDANKALCIKAMSTPLLANGNDTRNWAISTINVQ